MGSLCIKTTSGELVISAGAFVLVSGRDAIAQAIERRLKTFRGEWFLDGSIGVPYVEQALGRKAPNLAAVEQLLRAEILAVEGVISVLSLTLSLASSTRTLSGTFSASTSEGVVEGAI
jgi:hypothetical protein